MCEGCAYYVDNWIYGYQVYCANPTEIWLNPLGWVLLVFIVVGLIFWANKVREGVFEPVGKTKQ